MNPEDSLLPELRPPQWKKVVIALGWVALACLILFGTFKCGEFVGTIRTRALDAERLYPPLIERAYRTAVAGHIPELREDALFGGSVVDEFEAIERKHGKVEEYEVTPFQSDWLGINNVVTVRVKRGGAWALEHWFGHKVNGPFSVIRSEELK